MEDLELHGALKMIGQAMGNAMAATGATDCIVIVAFEGGGIEMMHGDATGRLFEMHEALRVALNSQPGGNFRTEHGKKSN